MMNEFNDITERTGDTPFEKYHAKFSAPSCLVGKR